MIQLPNECYCSEIKVHPTNWNKLGASIKKTWYIHYRNFTNKRYHLTLNYISEFIEQAIQTLSTELVTSAFSYIFCHLIWST